MKEILGAQFWNQEVESTKSLEAIVRALPSEPPPLGSQQSSKLSRSQQLLLFQRLFAVPCTPSYAVDSDNGGGWVFDRVLASTGGRDWWATLTGRIRAQRLWSPGKGQNRQTGRSNDSANHHGQEQSSSRTRIARWARQLKDPSLYALCGRGRFLIGPQTSLSASSEVNSLSDLVPQDDEGSKTPWRGRVTLRHKLRKHDMTLEAAWHECCVDREACYWDVPQTLSLDLSSHGARGGLRYRVGVHRTSGSPVRCEQSSVVKVVPRGAEPGTRAQAAITVEKEVALWKGPTVQTNRAHNVISARPFLTVSGLLGGLLSANMRGISPPQSVVLLELDDGRRRDGQKERPRLLSTDLFASAGLTCQLGKFERLVFDHTSVSLRVDCGAASVFANAAKQVSTVGDREGGEGDAVDFWDERGCPTLAVTVQQQLFGPLRARVDTRLALDPLRLSDRPRPLETTYGVDCALGKLGAVKLVAWYSPTRREGMAEVRLLER